MKHNNHSPVRIAAWMGDFFLDYNRDPIYFKEREHASTRTVDAIENGINVLVVDLFQPSRFDPLGMHHALRIRLSLRSDHPEQAFSPRSTFASYCLSLPRHIDMFVEYLEADMQLPEMPIFLDGKHYVNVPLEATYQRAWEGTPAFWREVVLRKSVA